MGITTSGRFPTTKVFRVEPMNEIEPLKKLNSGPGSAKNSIKIVPKSPKANLNNPEILPLDELRILDNKQKEVTEQADGKGHLIDEKERKKLALINPNLVRALDKRFYDKDGEKLYHHELKKQLKKRVVDSLIEKIRDLRRLGYLLRDVRLCIMLEARQENKTRCALLEGRCKGVYQSLQVWRIRGCCKDGRVGPYACP